MASTDRRFDFFHEAPTPEGAEGWENMYPYYLVPSEETRDFESGKFWFADTMHWSRGAHPFDSIGAEAVYLGAGTFSTRIFALPTSLGLDVRIFNGYVYISPTPVTDPEQIQERTKYFQRRAGYYYENWDELYAKWKTKMEETIAAMDTISFSALPQYDPEEVVDQARGRSIGIDVLTDYHRLVDEFLTTWQYHFEFLNLGYGGYITFFQFCKKAFPLITDQTISRMVAGIDVLAFRPDDECRRLAQLACDLDLDQTFQQQLSPEDLWPVLDQSEAGRSWRKSFEETRVPWFNYFAEYGFTHDQQTWNSDLSIPLDNIAKYVAKISADEDISRPVERLRTERDELVTEHRALLTQEEAAQFDALLGLARKVFPYIEEHNIYVEHWAHDVFWKKARQLARFFTDMGFLEDETDMFYLNRFEVDTALADLVQSWAIGVPYRGAKRWQAEVTRRRPIVEALQKNGAAPAYGAPPATIDDPFAVMNYGVTTERVNEWLGTAAGASDEINGNPGSLGIVEGPVRVLQHERELADLQPGEILVAPITAPSWASAFAVATGVITDIGGTMCHAAIVCREYGIPAVVGTGFATSRLTTGQRVRIDGKTGKVVLLDIAGPSETGGSAEPVGTADQKA